jgi:transposase
MIGYDENEVLDVEPARYFVRVARREQRAGRDFNGGAVVLPEAAPRVIEKALASDRVVFQSVIANYCDHLPLFRLATMLEREGLAISRATLDGRVMRVGELLQPVVRAIRQGLLADGHLQADETISPVQMPDQPGADHQVYLWQYGRRGGATVFDFQLRRGREGPVKFLDQLKGILQTGGYAAYDRVVGPKLVHVGGWAHARRKFVDAVKVNPQEAEAVKMVTRMDAVFLVDRHAHEQGLNPTERRNFRRQHAMDWVDEIHRECRTISKTVLLKSALAQAVAYTLNMWPKLRRFFDHGHVELSNNLAENSMRPVAFGRKNWPHVGSGTADRRSRRFCRWSSPASGWAFRSRTTCSTCCPAWHGPRPKARASRPHAVPQPAPPRVWPCAYEGTGAVEDVDRAILAPSCRWEFAALRPSVRVLPGTPRLWRRSCAGKGV